MPRHYPLATGAFFFMVSAPF